MEVGMLSRLVLLTIALIAVEQTNAEDPYAANGLDRSRYTVETIPYSRLRPTDQASILADAQKVLRKFPDLRAIVQTRLPTPSPNTRSECENKAGLKELGLASISFTIAGIGGADLYLIDRNDACIRVPGNKRLAEGTSYAGFAKAAGVFEYVTVLGARRRIPKYEYVFAEDVTARDLEKHLADGNTVFIPHTRTVKCPECRGQGRRSVHKDVRERGSITRKKLVREDCPHCKGRKTVDLRIVFALTK